MRQGCLTRPFTRPWPLPILGADECDPGILIKDRFELERLAGAGGMGEVFRARDRKTGEHVAVKVLFDRHSSRDTHFEREAPLLAELPHPGLVRYLAHGVTESGEQYLVMEWLEGEDLGGASAWPASASRRASPSPCARPRRSRRRTRGASSTATSSRATSSSSAARLDDVKLLDFGIARLGSARGG